MVDADDTWEDHKPQHEGYNVELADCGACGAIIPIDSKECPSCGVDLGGLSYDDDLGECGSCGALVPVDSASCPVCHVGFSGVARPPDEDEAVAPDDADEAPAEEQEVAGEAPAEVEVEDEPAAEEQAEDEPEAEDEDDDESADDESDEDDEDEEEAEEAPPKEGGPSGWQKWSLTRYHHGDIDGLMTTFLLMALTLPWVIAVVNMFYGLASNEQGGRNSLRFLEFIGNKIAGCGPDDEGKVEGCKMASEALGIAPDSAILFFAFFLLTLLTVYWRFSLVPKWVEQWPRKKKPSSDSDGDDDDEPAPKAKKEKPAKQKAAEPEPEPREDDDEHDDDDHEHDDDDDEHDDDDDEHDDDDHEEEDDDHEHDDDDHEGEDDDRGRGRRDDRRWDDRRDDLRRDDRGRGRDRYDDYDDGDEEEEIDIGDEVGVEYRGETFRATIVEFDDDSVVVRRKSNGRLMTVPFDTLYLE